MSQEFLYQLLRMENRVQNTHDEEECCSICCEEYGTLSRATGIMEVAMRLPCDHCIGSACITTWLKDHNSCPLCRREFFPVQPREDEEDQDDWEDEDEIDADDYDHFNRSDSEVTIKELIEDYCQKLLLADDIPSLSLFIARKLSQWNEWTQGHTKWCVAAVSIYIASFVSREPRSPRDIYIVSLVDDNHIRSAYDELYPLREYLADDDMTEYLCEADTLYLLNTNWPSDASYWHLLNWPTRDSESIDTEIESEFMAQKLRQGCEEVCNELDLGATIAELSKLITEKLYGLRLLLHSRAVVGAGILVASYCMGNATVTFNRVAEMVRTDKQFLSKYGVGHIVVVFTIDFYEEKLDYVQWCHVTKSRDPLSTHRPLKDLLRLPTSVQVRRQNILYNSISTERGLNLRKSSSPPSSALINWFLEPERESVRNNFFALRLRQRRNLWTIASQLRKVCLLAFAISNAIETIPLGRDCGSCREGG